MGFFKKLKKGTDILTLKEPKQSKILKSKRLKRKKKR